jgi:hypothetical protein
VCAFISTLMHCIFVDIYGGGILFLFIMNRYELHPCYPSKIIHSVKSIKINFMSKPRALYSLDSLSDFLNEENFVQVFTPYLCIIGKTNK